MEIIMQRQLALKILAVFVVGMLALIPISMVKYKVYERQGYLEQAKSAVAQSWTGEQLIITPVMVIPYRTVAQPASGFYTDKGQPIAAKQGSSKLSILLPDQLTNHIEVTNKNIFKGIYEVPVYGSRVVLSGKFSPEKLNLELENIRGLPQFDNMGAPYLAVHISDMRGIDQTPELQLNQVGVALQPGSKLPRLASGLHGSLGDDIIQQQALAFSLNVALRGMGSFSFVSLADDATTQLNSDWPHPEFIGSSLPKERNISSDGFSASWVSSRYSSNGAKLMDRCLNGDNCNTLIASSSGVNFIEPVDIYLQSERSIKYAILFIGLSFITFFIFEHITRQRIHPIQYAFTGLAISVFYLLLISLAEHIAFHWAYLIGVISCSSLILFYVRYMLRSILSAALFSAMIIALYGLLYVIVQAEDFALLMGSILVFLVLSVLMYVTREIDWYSLASQDEGVAELAGYE
jgi:inner membrane protein